MFMFALPKKGFVLLYTLLIISVSLVLVFSMVDSSLNELRFSGDELRSVAAFYAADTAIECARYWQNATAELTATDPTSYPYTAFDTRHIPAPYSCGFGEGFLAGQGSSGSQSCGAAGPATYSTRLQAFNAGINAPYVDLTVTADPVPSEDFCSVSFEAHGRNDRRSGAANLVERARWETWGQ